MRNRRATLKTLACVRALSELGSCLFKKLKKLCHLHNLNLDFESRFSKISVLGMISIRFNLERRGLTAYYLFLTCAGASEFEDLHGVRPRKATILRLKGEDLEQTRKFIIYECRS